MNEGTYPFHFFSSHSLNLEVPSSKLHIMSEKSYKIGAQTLSPAHIVVRGYNTSIQVKCLSFNYNSVQF